MKFPSHQKSMMTWPLAMVTMLIAYSIGMAGGVGYPGSYVDSLSSKGGGGANTLPSELEDVGIVEHLGQQIPVDAVFLNEDGKEVRIRDFLQSGRPVLVNFAYFKCPMLCNLVMSGMLKAMKDLPWVPGKEYEVVTIDIDHREGPDLASAKKANHITELNKSGAEKGWHFLTGKEEQIKRVADAVGFQYKYDAPNGQYAHAAGIFTVSPEGKVMRYLYGIEYKPLDLRLALLDASKGRSLSIGDKIMTLCYRYDADAKSYVLFANKFMRGGGFLVVLALLGFLGYFWRKEFKRKVLAQSVVQPQAV
jgi:protein SCO1